MFLSTSSNSLPLILQTLRELQAVGREGKCWSQLAGTTAGQWRESGVQKPAQIGICMFLVLYPPLSTRVSPKWDGSQSLMWFMLDCEHRKSADRAAGNVPGAAAGALPAAHSWLREKKAKKFSRLNGNNGRGCLRSLRLDGLCSFQAPSKIPRCYLSSAAGTTGSFQVGPCLDQALSHFSAGQRYPDPCPEVSQEPLSHGQRPPMGALPWSKLSLQPPNTILTLLGSTSTKSTGENLSWAQILDGSRSRARSRILGSTAGWLGSSTPCALPSFGALQESSLPSGCGWKPEQQQGKALIHLRLVNSAFQHKWKASKHTPLE